MEQANNEVYVRKAMSKFACMLDTVFCTLLNTVTSSLQRSICPTLLACHQSGAAADVHVVSRRLITLSMLKEWLVCNYSRSLFLRSRTHVIYTAIRLQTMSQTLEQNCLPRWASDLLRAGRT